jgi:type IV secretion system protein VirD4
MEMPKWAKWLFGIIVFAVASVGIVWLAGFLFFAFSKAIPFGKTDFSTWWTYWQAYQGDPIIAKRLKVSGIVAAVIGYGVPLAATLAAMREIRLLHGDARFANNAEIHKSGLLGNAGIILGKLDKRFLMFPGLQFVLLAAATRTGKGVGIVVPNLLHWPDSVVNLDVKLENFLITSKYRASRGQKVFLFNPFAISEDGEGNPLNGRTHRYNPLGYVSDDPRMRVTDILTIGYSLFPGEGRDSFFDDAARNLFLGLTLYLCETPTLPRTFGELLRQSSGKGQLVKTYLQGLITARNFCECGDVVVSNVGDDVDKVLKAVMSIRGIGESDAQTMLGITPLTLAENVPKAEIKKVEALLKDAGATFETTLKLLPVTQWDGVGLPPLSMECVDAINRFTATSDNTLSSIMASFNTPLTIWASPIMDAATSANDFDLRDVRKMRMSIYLGIPANKLAESRLLLNLFYTQLINLNTNQLLHSTPKLKYVCLLLNDEATAPGRIGIIDKANAYLAGYGFRLLTIIQSPGQLEADAPKGYGKEGARTLMTNHACQILYTPREQRDANEYSEMLGTYTFKAKGLSRQRGGKSAGGYSESESDQRRALMLPQELKELPLTKEIINLENTKPIKADKIFYYRDRVFVDRLKSIAPSLHALGRKLPSKKQLEHAWGSGELAASVPLLDLDLHDAIVQERMRALTTADVAKGIDLRKLALDTSKIPLPAAGTGLAPEQVEDFVNGFFDALDAADGDSGEDDGEITGDGSSDRPSDDELAALDAQAAVEDAPAYTAVATKAAPPSAQALAGAAAVPMPPQHFEPGGHARPEPEILRHDETGEPDELNDEEMAAMMENQLPHNDSMMSEADMLAAMEEMDDAPVLPEKRVPILDLSVLDRPLHAKVNEH